MKTSPFIVGVALASILSTGCSKQQTSTAPPPKPKKYTLSVEGTPGLRLNLLIIKKTETGSLDREDAEISLPYSKDFEAVKCAVWLDSTFRGKEGKYRMELATHGVGSSSESGNVLERAGGYSLLHDL